MFVRKSFKFICVYFFIFTFSLYGNQNAKYIGSLLNDPPTAVPYKQFVFRNFFFFHDQKGLYESCGSACLRKDAYYSFQYRFQGFFGLTRSLDLSLFANFYANYKGRYAYFNTGDLNLGLDFQILNESQYLPGIKIAVREEFPLGHYQLFTPKRGDIEKTGSGCYGTQLALFLFKEFPLSLNWLITVSTQVAYQINSWAQAKGFHSYGGGFGTNGKVWVGNLWQSLINIEVFYKDFIFLSLDGLYRHQNQSLFYGHPGFNFYGRVCSSISPSSDQISIAPSLGFLFSQKLGLLIGSWGSVWGRNTEQFLSYAANLFYVF